MDFIKGGFLVLGLLYLILATYVGSKLLKKFVPYIYNLSSQKTLYGSKIKLQNWIVVLPASFVTGTLFMTWLTYLSAYFFKNTHTPLLYGNIISFSVFLLAAIFLNIADKSNPLESVSKLLSSTNKTDEQRIISILSKNKLPLLYLLFIVSFVSYFMIHSFKVQDGIMKVGWSVYSDFGPHLSMIRSFSLGNNFPTEYPHFADGHIRYHFMFQFLAGNLEYLGLRIDWAFNLPSILSMVSFLTLLYGLAVILTGKAWVGIMSGVFFLFRSSAAILTYFMDQKSINNGIKKILESMDFIGKTPYENWGLWTFKDYVNQRHFSFSMGILILIVIIMYPVFMKMISEVKSLRIKSNNQKAKQPDVMNNELQQDTSLNTSSEVNQNSTEENNEYKSAFSQWLDTFIFSRDSWLPGNYTRALALGVLLGSISFWHGSILISALLVLFFMAIFSKHRLEYLIIALITVGFSFVQTAFFMGPGSSAVHPEFRFGFVAENHTLLGVAKYYLELCGILPLVLLAALVVVPKGGRWLMLSFFAPLVFATTVTLVPDVAINHKYVAVSIILLNIFAADFVHKTFVSKDFMPKISAVLLVFALTITGIANTFTLNNMDKHYSSIDLVNPVRDWVKDNTETSDVFLTDDVVINQVLLAGRRIFSGYGYFTGSAGYDVEKRNNILKQIYGGNDAAFVKKLAKENNIKYILIDNAVRSTDNNFYFLNEELFRNNFVLLKHFDYDNTDIYLVE